MTSSTRNRIRFLLVSVINLTPGCSTLPLQKDLAGHVTNALQTCQREPARCAAAAQCSRAATEAAEALQRVRGAELAGTIDAAALQAGIQAQALPPAALAQCKALGFKFVPPPSDRVPPRPEGGLADRLGAMATPAGVP